MRSKTSSSEYLALLSSKYEVDADQLFNALISARNNRRTTCGSLSIECRDKQKDRIIILITKGPKVVAQFPISEELLLEQSNPIKEALEAYASSKCATGKDRRLESLQIKDLRIGMKSVTLKAEVVEIAEPMRVVTRFGNYASVANALVSDETGKIKLCLWNEQIDAISVGDMVKIENARIAAFRGNKQVRVGRSGILRITRPWSSTRDA